MRPGPSVGAEMKGARAVRQARDFPFWEVFAPGWGGRTAVNVCLRGSDGRIEPGSEATHTGWGRGRRAGPKCEVRGRRAKHVISRVWRCSLRVGAGVRLSMCAYGARMGVSNRDPSLPTRVGAVVVGRDRNPRCAADVPST